jgi:hypothetical protein
LVAAGHSDPILFTGPLGVEQLFVFDAIVKRFQDRRERYVVLFGYFPGRERLLADGLAIQNLRTDATEKELLVTRAPLGFQILVVTGGLLGIVLGADSRQS